MPDPHEPVSPSWHCRDCGRDWPCPSRRQILLDEYRQQSTNLRVYLAACLTSATQDLAANPADLRNRFLGWVPHRVPS
ncbi:hypothetical protein ABZ754_18410 [Micromonospora purpureochromogenes]|uniref:hypothetical protein n=1 Tax=Micromonospora purpureochromogenes TaxID=47872 RepID=UPI0033D925B0